MPSRQRSAGVEARDVAPVEPHRAGIGRDRAGDEVEERRLAGAVRADDPERLALLHVEVERVRHDERAVALGEAGEAEDRRHESGSGLSLRS